MQTVNRIGWTYADAFHGLGTMQKTLFPDERPAKIARASDPETSHDAAAEMLPKLSILEEYMLQQWLNHGPLTSNEAAILAERPLRFTTLQPSVESLRKRYTGLLAKGQIVADGKKRCNITGKLATVYRIKDSE